MDYLIARLPGTVADAESSGDFALALALIDGLLRRPLPGALAERLRFEKERIYRLRKAYAFDRRAAQRAFRRLLKGFRNSELDGWIKAGHVSPRMIDGREKFARAFASNAVFCLPALKKRIRAKTDGKRAAEDEKFFSRVDELAAGASPAKYRVRARITLTLKKAPRDKVRCWLPFPRVGDQVSAARLLAASHKRYRLAPPSAGHRTIYLEGKNKRFFAEFEYDISEWTTTPGGGNNIPLSARKRLREEPPHVSLSPYIRGLAASIVGDEKNNYRKAARIYDWLTENLTYNFTLPYGVYEGISEHALASLRGDCGFMALAFIALCRAAGVPAKWQSGWVVREGHAGYHDWAMFYAGHWRPVDVSFGVSRRAAGQEKRRRFYFGNLDAGRMVANSEFGAPLWPRKRYWRTDPTDNQMGEAETAAGNIYTDGFRSRIKVLGFKRLVGRASPSTRKSARTSVFPWPAAQKGASRRGGAL